jgi:hypothetical protein
MTKQKAKKRSSDSLPTEDLSEEGQSIVDLFNLKLAEVTDRFTELLQEKNERIEKLEREVTTLKSSIGKFEERVDDAESMQRRDDIIISGDDVPCVVDNENCPKVACNLIKEKLQVNIKLSNVMSATRIGKKPPTQKPDKRNLLVKFSDSATKSDLLGACKTVKPKGLFINENLIPKRSNILYCLRQAKKKFHNMISGCSTRDMNVFVWLKPPNPDAEGAKNTRMQVNTYNKLQEFCSKVLKAPLTSFVDESNFKMFY